MSIENSTSPVCSVEGCEANAYGRKEWCRVHYRRWQKYGNPTTLVRGPYDYRPKGESLHDALWSRVDTTSTPDGCWEWVGTRNPMRADGVSGYGKLYRDGEMQLAHRLMWQLLNRPLRRGEVVRHKCDNPPCCRPSHLEIGTARDNVLDAVKRGRARRVRKITYKQVAEIHQSRKSGETYASLAETYGISRSHAYNIVHGIRRRR